MLKPILDAKPLAEVLHKNFPTTTNYVITHSERLAPFVRPPSGKTLWFDGTQRLGSTSDESRSAAAAGPG